MPSNPHDDAIQADPTLRQLVANVEPLLTSIDKVQVEKLVFFLKAMHSYYPKSENHVAYWTDFGNTLEALRNSPEQRALQARASRKVLLGMLACFTAGLLLAPTLGSLLGFSSFLGAGLGAISAIGLVLFSDVRLFKQAMLVAKEQDRKYFLSSLRAARACNELGWAGLFAYATEAKSGPQSDADIQRAATEAGELAGSLRDALYNDDFFQYSNLDEKRIAPGEA